LDESGDRIHSLRSAVEARTAYGEDILANGPQPAGQDIESLVPGVIVHGAPREGGQGYIFQCSLGMEHFALKVVPVPDAPLMRGLDDSEGDPVEEEVARAQRELALLASCDSPHLAKVGPVPLTEADIGGQRVILFSEEWVEGDDVLALVTNHPLPLEEVLSLGIHIAKAIEALAAVRAVHRDIKPNNIIRRRAGGEYVLIDLGYALVLTESSLTVPGNVVGTRFYLSPEQMQPGMKRSLDFRSDQFLLGLVMYQAATQRHPFFRLGMTDQEYLDSILRQPTPPPPSARRAEIPAELDAVILRLLAKHPHLRYQSCGSLITALNVIACPGRTN
jgi:eukaryotic-like serine/threonine-protein kinase